MCRSRVEQEILRLGPNWIMRGTSLLLLVLLLGAGALLHSVGGGAGEVPESPMTQAEVLIRSDLPNETVHMVDVGTNERRFGLWFADDGKYWVGPVGRSWFGADDPLVAIEGAGISASDARDALMEAVFRHGTIHGPDRWTAQGPETEAGNG